MGVPDEDDEGDPERFVHVGEEVEDSLVPFGPEFEKLNARKHGSRPGAIRIHHYTIVVGRHP